MQTVRKPTSDVRAYWQRAVTSCIRSLRLESVRCVYVSKRRRFLTTSVVVPHWLMYLLRIGVLVLEGPFCTLNFLPYLTLPVLFRP